MTVIDELENKVNLFTENKGYPKVIIINPRLMKQYISALSFPVTYPGGYGFQIFQFNNIRMLRSKDVDRIEVY